RPGRAPGLLRARRAGAGGRGGARRPVERRRLLPDRARRMNLAACLRDALERGHRSSPELLAGDVLDDEALGRGITPAAVLVAIVDRPEPTVILTLRPETM